jgi:alpha-ribazole phosphatase
MKLTIVRHGETLENVRQTIQGHLPGHLTDKGKLQAQEAANTLRGRSFDAIYCSDIQRCLDTAKPIREVLPDVPFITDELLRERRGGSMEGKPLALLDVHKELGDWYSYRLPGGESWDDVRARQAPLLNKLFEKYPSGSILIVTHRGPLRGIRSLLEDKSQAQIDEDVINNGGIWEETMTSPVHE